MPDEVTNNAENQQLKAQNELLKRENGLLKEKIDRLIRRIFGVKSEKLDPGQLEAWAKAKITTGLKVA